MEIRSLARTHLTPLPRLTTLAGQTVNPAQVQICLFVCLFDWRLSPHSRILHSYGDVTITCEGLQILTYARHSWPLSIKGSLSCHTYCDIGHPFIVGHLQGPVTLTLIAERLALELSLPVLLLRSVAAGIRTLNLPPARQTLLPTASSPRLFQI